MTALLTTAEDQDMRDTGESGITSTVFAGPVLWITGLPDDDDDGELEMRLARFGELKKLDREGETAVAYFRHTKASSDAKQRLNGYTFGSGRTIAVDFAPLATQKGALGPFAAIDEVTGQVVRKNSELHFKIGQLVRSTYSAMRATNGNYPPAKQNLSPEDFKYLESARERLEMESHWGPSMSIAEMIADYDAFADRRPFHNRYVVVLVNNGNQNTGGAISNFAQSVVGERSLVETTEFDDHSIFHLSFKSTRDAGILHSALTTSLQSGQGGLVGQVDVQAVKYGPPVNTANTTGKLWLGCSAFVAIDERKLASMLELFGQVEQMRLVKPKNCLFVAYRTQEEAIVCRNKLFSFEIAPGHFLNTDFAPPAPEYAEANDQHSRPKRRYSGDDTPESKRTYERPIRIELSKMGDRMCGVLARQFFVRKDESQMLEFTLPREIDICNRTKVEYCKVHLEKLGCDGPIRINETTKVSDLGTVVVWQFAAASENDCKGYDALCDYFVEKDRIGFHSSGPLVTYFIPPVEKFLNPVGLPSDTRYLTAIQLPAVKPQ